MAPQRIKKTVIRNPCSGRYEGSSKGLKLEMNVDVDQINEHSKVLDMVSGNISAAGDYKPWSGASAISFFQTVPGTLNVKMFGINSKRVITAEIKVVMSDGSKCGGKLETTLMLPQDSGDWNGKIEVIIGTSKCVFENISKTNRFFREVTLDIDYTEKLVWPVVELMHLQTDASKRKIDAFSAFEDAGLKLHFDKANSQKIVDPTPESPWTKSDMYEAMLHYFDETLDSDDNIWCMMGTTPPDKRYMGFSFDTKGRHGFGLFTSHKSFSGFESSDPLIRAKANRCLLHYFVHECGHCLGLEHPFDIGEGDSLSWMNYSWKYDERHLPGSFYESFEYTFSVKELRALRHQPSKAFQIACRSDGVIKTVGYSIKSDIPDISLADDDSDDEESVTSFKTGKKKSLRQISIDLQLPETSITVGETLSFVARLKNIGKLPALVEGDLTIEGGNLKVYLTSEGGEVESVKSFVNPIQSGFTRPLVLYTNEIKEGQDRYSESVTIGTGKDGSIFSKPGNYSIRALYAAGRYSVTSDTYMISVNAAADDGDITAQVSMAATLGDASYSRFKQVSNYWKDLAKKVIEEKRRRISVFVKLSESLVSGKNRQQVYSGAKKARSNEEKNLKAIPASKSPKEILDETKDLVEYMHSKGSKESNLDYSQLVVARSKLYIMLEEVSDANVEFNQMLSDLLLRDVKSHVLQKLAKQWEKVKNPIQTDVKYTTQSLQKRFDEILDWSPTIDGNGEPDISGIGLGRPFSNFKDEDMNKGLKIIEILFNKYDETKDLRAVFSYADKLQKAREVNHTVLHWALEAFIVHSLDAKKAGIKYPEPRNMDSEMSSSAALISTRRTGQPAEDWINYWRCDADYNYHHRHWHIVYVVGRFVGGVRRSSPIFSSAPAHLQRQGELFGYMHNQMLARYDAERESWGLNPVQEWTYSSTTAGFNAGLEFHSAPQYRRYAPRPAARWPTTSVQQFQGWEAAYNRSLTSGAVFEGVELTPNWSGHVLEPSSGLYARTYGRLHNTGHGIFGSTGVPPGSTSYMNDTATACRDPIFYRWHRRLDNLWQANNSYYRSEIGSDAPPVTLTSQDVIIDTNPDAPAGFNDWNGDWVNSTPSEPKTIETNLGPARKRFEWDNKISHQPFYFHLRVKRNQGTSSSNEIRLTFRIFIVPKNRELEREKYIEMDKFVYILPSGVDHNVLTRADVHSSVIKRIPQQMVGDVETPFIRENPGFCECGWPYSMLLPRGTSSGQEYSLCVIATDNVIDAIGIRTTCGSMSFCGARGQAYPDSRLMGYPFNCPITVNSESFSIPEAFDRVRNATRISFIIKNNVAEPPAIPGVDVWWPFVQLTLNDGTSVQNMPVTDFISSGWTGRFRVLVDNDDARSNTSETVMLRLQGRGVGGGEYRIRDLQIGLRVGTSMDVLPNATVVSKGQESFTVPEEGLVTDPVSFRFDPALGDYFVTFTLDSPGVYLRANAQSQTTMTYRIADAGSVNAAETDWGRLSVTNRSRNVYCLAGIMAQF